MFAIAFDLVVADTARHHPKGVAQAYADIGSTLTGFGFNRVQGSLSTAPSEDLANLFAAITTLRRCLGCLRRYVISAPSVWSNGGISRSW